jgi:hypothetical protein
MMNACPLDPNFKNVVETFGEFQAYRDYMENGNVVRSLEDIRNKLISEGKLAIPSDEDFQTKTENYTDIDVLRDLALKIPGYQTVFEPITPFTQTIKATQGNAVLDFTIKDLASRLGVKYEFVTEDAAYSMLAKAGHKYTGEAGFFFGGTVYFIKDKVTLETAFHEFAHPFITAIARENPELHEKLFEELAKTPEGELLEQIVSTLHPDYDTTSEIYKSEVLVRALTKRMLDKKAGKEPSKGFTAFLKNLLYAIKQLFRKVIDKKLNISKLDENTTLNDLAKIYGESNIQLDVDAITNEDVVEFIREQKQEIDSIVNIMSTDEGAKAIQESMTRVYKTTKKTALTLKNQNNLQEMLDILSSGFGQSDLDIIKNNISAYEKLINQRFDDLITELDYINEKSAAFVNTLFQIRTMADKMVNHMKDISTRTNDPDSVKKMYHYSQVVSDWSATMKNIRESLSDVEGDPEIILDLVGSIEARLKTADRYIDKVNLEGSSVLLEKVLDPLAKEVDRYYGEIIDELRAKGASQSTIDRYMREYENSKVSKDVLKSWLAGERGDTNPISAWMESYMNIQDPVIFGLATYVYDNIVDVMNTAQMKYNSDTQLLKSFLDAAGYNPNNPKDLRQKVSYVEKEGIVGSDGKFIERDRYAYIHHVKGYDIEIKRINEKIKQAELKAVETGDRTEYDALVNERNVILQDFYDDYVDEVREIDKLFTKDDIGRKAFVRRLFILQKLQNHDALVRTPADMFDEDHQQTREMILREYKQLYSLSNPDGSLKEGEDLDITNRLLEHRNQRRQYFEWVAKPGVFQGALKAYEQYLVDTGHDFGSPSFNKKREEWINNNTVEKIKPEYFQRTQEIYDEIAEIKSKLPQNLADKLESDEILKEIRDQISGYRDENGQPDGSLMKPEKLARIKELDEQFEATKDDYITLRGVKKSEQTFFKEFEERLRLYAVGLISEDPRDNTDEFNMYLEIRDKMDNLGLSEDDISRLNDLYNELKAISTKKATTQYVDIINNLLQPRDVDDSVDVGYLMTNYGITEFDVNTIDEILNVDLADKLMSESSKFKDWYLKNHILTSYQNYKGETIEVYKRISAWSVSRPVSEEYYEKTEILDEVGNVVETIPGVPTLNYFEQKIKPQYQTKKVTMKEALEMGDISLATVDHAGRWLPKPNSKYRNEDYYNLKRNNKAVFDLSQKLLEIHLRNQDGLNVNARLGVMLSRFRKDSPEIIMSGDAKEKAKGFIKNAKAMFTRAKDDLEDGYNPEMDVTYMNLDMFDNEVSGIPIAGKYDLDLEETSDDVLLGIMRYMQSAERHKKLVEISPEVRALQKVVNSEIGAIKDTTKASKSDFLNYNMTRFLTKKGKSVRAQTINSFIEREFEGKTQAGALSNMPGINKLANNLLGLSSMAFFALDIPSALKNSLGARFQALIYASGGEHITPSSLTKGTFWGNMVSAEVSFQIYKYGPKSLNVQMYELFDPDQKYLDRNGKFAEGVSRTFTKDVLRRSWLTNTREWTQMNATLGLFGAVMHNQLVTQTINGVSKEIPYIEAWEIKNGQITLKEGIDPAWGVGGEKYKMIRRRVQAINRNLNGAYSEFDKAHGDRYLLQRLITFLKRHFVRMFMARFGYRGSFLQPEARWDVGSTSMQIGYYVQALSTLINGFRTMGRDFKTMNKREKAALKKFGTEFGLVTLAGMLIPILFSYDEDDEDRFEKLRRRSGAFPMPFSAESGYKFNLAGYMSNQALFLAKATVNENMSFLPFPGYGLDDYRAMLDFNSIAFGNTLSNYVKTMDNLLGLLTDDPSAYYKRAVGPYEWQDEGSPKVLNYLLKSIGVSGNQVDPVTRLKNLESIQNRLKG